MMMIPQQSRHTFANAAADKYNLCCLFLDWIVQCPFVAAYEKKGADSIEWRMAQLLSQVSRNRNDPYDCLA